MLPIVEREARLRLRCVDGQTVVLDGAMPIGRGGNANFLALHALLTSKEERDAPVRDVAATRP